jgi:hypothetical protein
MIKNANQQPTYGSVLVSIKSRMYFPPGDAKKLCDKIKNTANDFDLKSALCIVCVFGQTSKSDYEAYKYDASKMLRDLGEGENVAAVLCIPRNDRFGLTDIFIEMTTTPEQPELLLSHSFLRSWGRKLQAKDALRRYDEKKTREGVNIYKKLMEDLYPEEDKSK